MIDPRWMSPDEVLRLHDLILEASGGRSGLRSGDLLEAALARPVTLFSYGESDIFNLAACYAEAISRNHAFIDGNKRSAIMTAAIFLQLNGYYLAPQRGSEHADMMVELAQGNITREAVAGHLRHHSRQI